MAMVLSISETHPAPPCSIVILGASGDLARRKLLPALYNLEHCGQGLLPAETAVVGFARTPMSTEEFRTSAREAVTTYSRLKVEENCWRKFEDKLDYLGGLDQPDGFKRLRELLEKIEKARGIAPNRVFYFSIPPEAIRDSIERLHEAGLIRDLARSVFLPGSGREADRTRPAERASRSATRCASYLDESQIFRIDHYLGKETVQNLMVLRFANSIFEQPVEIAQCRPRPDHGGRRRRASARAQATTISRGATARHGAESHAASTHDARRWSRRSRCDAVSDPRSETQRAARDASDPHR